MKNYLLTALLIGASFSLFAQKGWNQPYNKKNHLYGSWGYNRSVYSSSDITFHGEHYDFTLFDVNANDRPTPFSLDPYFSPTAFTIPQYNLFIGYFFSEKWSVNIGADHMKYVMQQDQYAPIEGYIDVPNGEHNGIYNRQQMLLSDDFLMFEHTDGLNYLSVEFQYNANLFQFNEKHSINYYAGAGGGLLVPRSNVTLMNFPRYDEFHVAGYGLSAKIGLQAILWKHLTFNIESKNGYISMQDILTTGAYTSDRSEQTFWFSEITGTVGFIFDLTNPFHR